MATFHGIEVYEILENGNVLNAIYTNTGLLSSGQYAIDNEIARKVTFDNSGVFGTYNARYIETVPNPNVVTHCVLEITRRNEVFEFTWSTGSGIIWLGIGLRVGNNHIAVSYTNP